MVESNIETKDKKVGGKKSYTDIFIHKNKKRYGVNTESSRNHQIKNDDVSLNLYSINDNGNTNSYHKP